MIKNISLIGLLITTCIVFCLQKYQYVNFDVNTFLYIAIIMFVVGLLSTSILDLKSKTQNEEQFTKKEFFFISLLSLYQPLYFYAHNIVELNFKIGLFLCAFVYLQFILLFFLTNIFFKDKNKSLFIALIISFTLLNVNKNTLIFYIIAAVYLWFISSISLTKIKKPAIVFTSALLFLILFEFGSNCFKMIKSNIKKDTEGYSAVLPYIQKGTKNRDIYILLLDAYAGANTLKQKFGFDNSDFINELKKEGFYVFDKMYSNYDLSFASIPSILNLEYFENTKFATPNIAIENATLYKVAKIKGYKTIFIKNNFFDLKQTKYLEYIYKTQYSYYDTLYLFFLNSIYKNFIESDKIKKIIIKKEIEIKPLKILDKKFVFMHMFMPHSPYLYNEDGTFIEDFYDFEKGYLTYLKYTNKWTLKKIKELKKEGKNPPVIIITGDHGMRRASIQESSFSTLTAIYNPEQEYSHVKNSKTLINFFINFANYEFNTTFPNKQDIITCVQSRCGAENPYGIGTAINTKELLKKSLDLTDKFIKD